MCVQGICFMLSATRFCFFAVVPECTFTHTDDVTTHRVVSSGLATSHVSFVDNYLFCE